MTIGNHSFKPERIRGVSQSQFSIARYYGGIMFNGRSYIYMPETDELIREDVFEQDEQAKRELAKSEKAKYEKLKEAEDARQERLL